MGTNHNLVPNFPQILVDDKWKSFIQSLGENMSSDGPKMFYVLLCIYDLAYMHIIDLPLLEITNYNKFIK